ncbi:U-box domain-containing protein 33 [Eucalyptus grandis]|uniref:U-box domain-containing protein 33 n=1 Tax=Eucalyptus grandis TaxID=71139 RepID=UPI00192EA7ED|nr:U-box domain-containing protein 33 [Eucalyptus grandis]
MAVVDRMTRFPEFGVPSITPSIRGVTSEPATPVFHDKIYVAVREDVRENRVKLVWTVHQLGGSVNICIVHVLVPSQRIPMKLGGEMPASTANEKVLREHRENERKNMHKILDYGLLVCKQMGVQAEKEYIESDSVEKGIVELIRLHGIKKLVMGAAADKRYFKRMTEIKSRKAIFVRNKADMSCQIRFICDGQLIHTREARKVQSLAPSHTPTPGAKQSILPKSQSARLQRSGTAKLSNPIQDILKRTFSSNADPRAVTPIASPSPDTTPSEQPNAVTMLRSQDTFQELESFSTSLGHCPRWNESAYLTGHSSFFSTLGMNVNAGREVLEEEEVTWAKVEVDIIEGGQKDPTKMKYPQRSYAEKLEEELEKVKNQLDKVMEELHIAQYQKSQLKSQFVETDQSRKELEMKIILSEEIISTYRQERELLQNELDNALRKVEEVSRRQGHSSGTKYFSEFSMTEIKEAVQNFEPSLKIGEGGCGIVYKGFLRHMPVAIKTMKFQSMQGSQQFQQEVDVLSKVRHPNLIMLIGACAEPWTLVYEYFPNGSLEDWLHSSNRAKQLSWRARICIATELCSVLAFLHSYKPHSIVHGDVKPGNILLDAHLGCKLSDFGICRLLSQGERSSNNTTVLYPTVVKGTLGYMDPEFLITRELTTKFDVYSFGIILLELLTRRPALGLVNEVQKAIDAGTLKAILDPLAGEWPDMLAKELTHLALRCCEMSRRNRPDLGSDVWTVLQSIRASLGYT